METFYRITGFRKGDKTAKVTTYRKTRGEAEWWITEHYAEENGAHGYQVVKVQDSQEGYRSLSAFYVLDCREVTESEWLKAVRGW